MPKWDKGLETLGFERDERKEYKHEESEKWKGLTVQDHLAREQRGKRGDVERKVRTLQPSNIWSPRKCWKRKRSKDCNNVVPH